MLQDKCQLNIKIFNLNVWAFTVSYNANLGAKVSDTPTPVRMFCMICKLSVVIIKYIYMFSRE